MTVINDYSVLVEKLSMPFTLDMWDNIYHIYIYKPILSIHEENYVYQIKSQKL